MNQVIEAILNRRSVRSFTEKRISREELELITTAGKYGPSAVNRQGFQQTVIQNKELIAALAAAIPQYFESIKGEYSFYGADTLILLSDEADKPSGCQDCSCAAENIFLAAHSLGIGSVWINQFKNTCDKPDIRPLLTKAGVPENHTVWMGAALGYPAETPAPKEKTTQVKWCL